MLNECNIIFFIKYYIKIKIFIHFYKLINYLRNKYEYLYLNKIWKFWKNMIYRIAFRIINNILLKVVDLYLTTMAFTNFGQPSVTHCQVFCNSNPSRRSDSFPRGTLRYAERRGSSLDLWNRQMATIYISFNDFIYLSSKNETVIYPLIM